MHPREPDDDLQARIDRLERNVDSLHQKLDRTNTGGGGIGCLGFALFVFVLVKLDDIQELVEALAR